MSCCNNIEADGFGCNGAEEKETEMSNYTKQSEIAGKLLERMEEAWVKVPSVVLFADGSGHFAVYEEDEKVTREILSLYLPDVQPYRRSTAIKGEVIFDFSFADLEGYMPICHTCGRTLENELA